MSIPHANFFSNLLARSGRRRPGLQQPVRYDDEMNSDEPLAPDGTVATADESAQGREGHSVDVAADVGLEPRQDRSARMWVVRADSGKYTDEFVARGYAATALVDVASAESRDEMRRRYEEAQPEKNPQAVGVQVGQVATFLFDLRKGDYVITPEADTEWLRYGRVIGNCVSAAGDDGCPYRNRRAVDWAVTPIRRHSLSESLQNTLGSLLAVFEIDRREELLAEIGRIEQEDGIEFEHDDPKLETVERPFDPSKIKVRTIPVVVAQLVSRIGYEEIDLAPDFQRLRDIWKPAFKSRLVESLLLRIPIPVFYVAADEQENWAVVDGVQRMSTIYDYVKGKFPLTGLEYREEFNGKRYNELPRPMQRRINETQIVVNVIEPGTPAEVMFNIFHRINTGGKPLNGQEIRHALNPGPVRKYLKALAESEGFVTATDHSIAKERMADRECVLRFLAFYIEPWETYASSSLDMHLAATMRKINLMSADERTALAADFRKAMQAAERIFGGDAFRKRRHMNGARSPVSRPLFEAWSVQLARCSPDQIECLVLRREEVAIRFATLLRDDQEFENAISLSTGMPQRIRKRFAAICDLVQGFL